MYGWIAKSVINVPTSTCEVDVVICFCDSFAPAVRYVLSFLATRTPIVDPGPPLPDRTAWYASPEFSVRVLYHSLLAIWANGLFLSSAHCVFESAIYLNAPLIKLNAFSIPWVEFKVTLAVTPVSTSPLNYGNNFVTPLKFAKIESATKTDFVA